MLDRSSLDQGESATSLTGAAIIELAREAMTTGDLPAVILRVTVDGEEIVTAALGESMTGVPATADMHFRNGAVAISYMSTILLQLVDEGVVGLDDACAVSRFAGSTGCVRPFGVLVEVEESRLPTKPVWWSIRKASTYAPEADRSATEIMVV